MVNPNAQEVCDGFDNNCNGLTDDNDPTTSDASRTPYFLDEDDDGFGLDESLSLFCSAPSGYIEANGDCDDENSSINPTAEEICDGIDNDCNTDIDDNAVDRILLFVDSDGDGFGSSEMDLGCPDDNDLSEISGDCVDNNPIINPNAEEICDSIDNNCDDLTDDLSATDKNNYFIDFDEDGFGIGEIREIQQNPLFFCPSSETTSINGFSDNFIDVASVDAEQVNPGDIIRLYNQTQIAEFSIIFILEFIPNCNTGTSSNGRRIFLQDTNLFSTPLSDTLNEGFGTEANPGTWAVVEPNSSVAACSPPFGFVDNNEDCNDLSIALNPLAVEICDNQDNDCDGLIDDEDNSLSEDGSWFSDNDQDGYGNPDSQLISCTQPANTVSNDFDCNDNNSETNPDANEICDGEDNDCDGVADNNAIDEEIFFVDEDGDGFGGALLQACNPPSNATSTSNDCDDEDPAIYPTAEEICDGIDNNCDQLIDEDDPDIDLQIWYSDEDEDGFGNPLSPELSCSPIDGAVLNSNDCDDGDPQINPNAEEICDNKDNDCVGGVDDGTIGSTFFEDLDNDSYGSAQNTTISCSPPPGYAARDGDCNDSNGFINPGAIEICDEIDNDCDNAIDDNDNSLIGGNIIYIDSDLDGFGAEDGALSSLTCEVPDGYESISGDCDDNDALINPLGIETCDGIDEDCDDVVDSIEACEDEEDVEFEQNINEDGASTYLLVTQAKSWIDARNDCADRGYHLLTLDSPGEDEWINGTADVYSGNKWWIGLNDRDIEGDFRWQSDDTLPQYTNWHAGEPNNWGGNEDCVQLNRWGDSTWNDEPCEYEFFYICESF